MGLHDFQQFLRHLGSYDSATSRYILTSREARLRTPAAIRPALSFCASESGSQILLFCVLIKPYQTQMTPRDEQPG